MQKYTHDYTKAAKSNAYMYAALQEARRDNLAGAIKQILNARRLMDEYLSSDNMVPSEDIAFGWYRAEEVDHKL